MEFISKADVPELFFNQLFQKHLSKNKWHFRKSGWLMRARCLCWQNLVGMSFCKDCLSEVRKSLHPRSISFELGKTKLFAMSEYSPFMKSFIYNCKSSSLNGIFHSQHEVIRKLADFWKPELENYQIQEVVVVPGHPIRATLQTDLAWFLGISLAESLGLGKPKDYLRRKLFVKGRVVVPQKYLAKSLRKIRAEEQYSFASLYKGQNYRPRVLLVDDVCTTGTSMKVCVDRLVSAGFEVPAAIVLSKVEMADSS